jgi:HEAT repeat protein
MALGMTGDPYVRELLEETLLRGRLAGRPATPAERACAAWALGRLGHPRSLAPVVEAISRPAPTPVRASFLTAAGALARDRDPAEREAAVDALRKYLRKPDDPVNAGLACIALGRMGGEDALRVLLPLAERGKATLRPFAAIAVGLAAGRGALEKSWHNRAVNALARVTRRAKDCESRAAVLLARGLARDPTAVPELIPLVADEGDPLVRARACEALGLIGDASEAVTGALLKALRDQGAPDVRASAARGFALLHDKVATQLLRHEAATATGVVQVAAIDALGHHGDRAALAQLAEMLRDKRSSAEARAAAARALGRIANPAPALENLGKDFNYRSSVAELNELLTLH